MRTVRTVFGDDLGVHRLWIGTLFGNGFGSGTTSSGLATSGGESAAAVLGSVGCGRFAADVCAAYQASAQTGRPTAALQAIMAAASPATYAGRITAP